MNNIAVFSSEVLSGLKDEIQGWMKKKGDSVRVTAISHEYSKGSFTALVTYIVAPKEKSKPEGCPLQEIADEVAGDL